MSLEPSETWRVLEESGDERIVEVTHVTDRSFPYWEAWCAAEVSRGGMMSQNSARLAVIELAANHKWNAVEVLAPGKPSSAETIDAERVRIATMLRDHADERVNDSPEYAEALYDAESLVRGERPVYAPAATMAVALAKAWADGALAMRAASAKVARRAEFYEGAGDIADAIDALPLPEAPNTEAK